MYFLGLGRESSIRSSETLLATAILQWTASKDCAVQLCQCLLEAKADVNAVFHQDPKPRVWVRDFSLSPSYCLFVSLFGCVSVGDLLDLFISFSRLAMLYLCASLICFCSLL